MSRRAVAVVLAAPGSVKAIADPGLAEAPVNPSLVLAQTVTRARARKQQREEPKP